MGFHVLRPALFAALCGSCVIACAGGGTEDGNTTFGSATHNPTAPSTMTTSPTSSSSDTEADSDDSGPGPTTFTDTDTDTGDASGVTGTEETGEVPSEQPTSGMYSACLDPSMCVGQTTCFTITEGVDVVDGFCTTAPCTDAMTTCDPSPGGTAVPICIDMVVAGNPTTGCALDCSAGKTCPAGMQCYNLADAQVCV